MSLLVDPPALFADGEGWARAMPEAAQGRGAAFGGALTTALFWATAAAFWFDHPIVKPLRRRLGYRSGREFMLRFPFPDRGSRRGGDSREDALAIAGFAAYPLWWWLGWDHGRRARPRGA